MSKRIRRHVDPLQCRVAVEQEDWMEPYRAHGEGEIWLDLGCGKGELLARLAETLPSIFFIGIEVRRSIAERFFPRYRRIPNLLLLHGNANFSVPSMMGRRKVQKVLIHFPDPCDHKPRYRKRQMVNESLVNGLREILAPGGIVSFKTDRREMFEEMDPLFLSCFKRVGSPSDAPAGEGLLSEWEEERLEKSIPIYSLSYRRT
jgi:tRNA (guanine-N7-)-methyltransferase